MDKREDGLTFQRIVEADRKSEARNGGHGNAIAQVYNHIIMPLAGDYEMDLEIDWGIRSFQKDFGRDPEGIWLSETAINDRTAEHLISFGMKFVILTPGQGLLKNGGGPADPSKPYILSERNGEIAVFFTSTDIASKISFEHILRNVEYFRNEIMAHNKTDKKNFLIHTATDGESYGHHEPFADMCLARLIFNNTRHDFTLTNYARYVEL